MRDDSEQVTAVAEEILRYLRTHPEAADTTRGIARWWLQRQPYEDTVELVAKALERLLREGAVVQTLTRNGNTIYRRRRGAAPAQENRWNGMLH
jgi:hypothetical protein